MDQITVFKEDVVHCVQLGLMLISDVYASGGNNKVAGTWAKEIPIVRCVNVSWLTWEGKTGQWWSRNQVSDWFYEDQGKGPGASQSPSLYARAQNYSRKEVK